MPMEPMDKIHDYLRGCSVTEAVIKQTIERLSDEELDDLLRCRGKNEDARAWFVADECFEEIQRRWLRDAYSKADAPIGCW